MRLSCILAFEGDRSVMQWISYSALGRRVRTKNARPLPAAAAVHGHRSTCCRVCIFAKRGSKPQPKPTCAPCSTSRERVARCASPPIGSCARIPSDTGGGAGSGGSSGARELLGSDQSVSLRTILRKSLTLSSGAPWLRSVRFLKDSLKKIYDFELGSCQAQIGPFP